MLWSYVKLTVIFFSSSLQCVNHKIEISKNLGAYIVNTQHYYFFIFFFRIILGSSNIQQVPMLLPAITRGWHLSPANFDSIKDFIAWVLILSITAKCKYFQLKQKYDKYDGWIYTTFKKLSFIVNYCQQILLVDLYFVLTCFYDKKAFFS